MVLNLILWPFNTVSFSCYSDPQPRIILLIFHNYNFATVKNCNINIWHGISKRIRTHRLRTTTLDLLPLSVLALSITYLALLVPEKAGSTFQKPSSETDQLSKRKNATGGVDLRKIFLWGAFHGHKSPTTLSMIFEVWGRRQAWESRESCHSRADGDSHSDSSPPVGYIVGINFPTKPNLLDIGFPK